MFFLLEKRNALNRSLMCSLFKKNYFNKLLQKKHNLLKILYFNENSHYYDYKLLYFFLLVYNIFKTKTKGKKGRLYTHGNILYFYRHRVYHKMDRLK